MSERYCPKCSAEVEDLGGFCALGHSLMLTPITEISELGDLRAEVDKAFAEAELQVASVLASVTGKPPPPPPTPAVEEDIFIEYDEEARERYDTFWKTLENDPEPSRSDPITAFAPAPRMDWGPDRSDKKRRKG
jgi:hypothetical protein